MQMFIVAQLVDGLSYWHWDLLYSVFIVVPNIATYFAFRRSKIKLFVSVLTLFCVLIAIASLMIPAESRGVIAGPVILCTLAEIVSLFFRLIYLGIKQMNVAVKKSKR